MIYKKLLAAVAASFIAGTASAATVSSTGAFAEIPVPASVTNATPSSSTEIQYYNEMQGVVLGSALTTDQGVIAAGTAIDSHMFFLNRPGGGAVTSLRGTLTFATMVLGTISDEDGALMVLSDYLGAPTTYDNFNNRGLELGGGNADVVTFLGDTVTAALNVTQPGDWVRVITVAAVPVPASILLLPLGLGALGAVRRRRRKTA